VQNFEVNTYRSSVSLTTVSQVFSSQILRGVNYLFVFIDLQGSTP